VDPWLLCLGMGCALGSVCEWGGGGGGAVVDLQGFRLVWNEAQPTAWSLKNKSREPLLLLTFA
jgi:hypothetical protein